MSPLRTILAATDLSALARHAVTRAALIAQSAGARLSLEHVVSLGAFDALRALLDAGSADLQQTLLDEVRSEVHALAADIHAHHGVDADIHLVVGGVLDQIVRHADAIDADLLVLGARGEGFMRELLLGSTTERVLRKTTRPLLVVKQIAREAYRRVLLPVDFSARSVEALRLAQALAPQAEIVLLHAFEVPFEGKLRYAGVEEPALSGLRVNAKREASGKMNDFVAAAAIDPEKVCRLVLHGEASSLILEQEQEQDCDLIVIGKRGAGVVGELLLGSVTKHILTQSAADVLVADRATT
jgi:nucleotide-binding universal stress UspA family protein